MAMGIDYAVRWNSPNLGDRSGTPRNELGVQPAATVSGVAAAASDWHLSGFSELRPS